MAECFAQSTLKCSREVPRAPGEPRTNTWHVHSHLWALTRRDVSVSLTGTKSAGAKGAAAEGDREDAESRAGHGAFKKPSFDDE